ncbi:glycosyltransferase family 4 protein [Patescibacteria group bacterium]|nr:glycosyltransferase family 4 protein [Patescibacteria group bacterium]MBU2219673.1 glycosyltransferase family 4 protein [Patescibacteria group bacterium]MBU2264830.1 glycosyltransferase family 4 protein [Patescibacteria group bacterium]
MKKVLIFSTAYLPLIGGAELAVKEITDRLVGDFEFDLICARIKKELPRSENAGTVNIYRVGWGWGKIDKFLLSWRGAALASKLHAAEKYNMVWAIMASFGGLAALKFKLKYRAIPYLLTLQEGDTPKHIASRAQWLGPYYKKMFMQADYIQAISNFLANWAKNMGVKCPIEVVPNGVDIDKFQETRNNNQKLKEELNIKPEEKVIITVSRLVKKNGVEDLIQAMSFLPENTKLLIVGDGEKRAHLSFVIGNLSLGKRIFLLGSVSPGSVADYLSISDLFVRPSLSEGLGSAFLEAMAAGVPIIGTRVGGIPDFLADGETGLFCEVSNPKNIAEKIELLLNDDNLRQKLIFNGKKLVEEKYNWNIIAKQIKAIFRKLKIEN